MKVGQVLSDPLPLSSERLGHLISCDGKYLIVCGSFTAVDEELIILRHLKDIVADLDGCSGNVGERNGGVVDSSGSDVDGDAQLRGKFLALHQYQIAFAMIAEELAAECLEMRVFGRGR